MQSVLEDVTESGYRQEWFDAVVTMWSLLEESGSQQNGHHLLLEDAAKDVNIGVLQLTIYTLHYIYTTLAVVSLLTSKAHTRGITLHLHYITLYVCSHQRLYSSHHRHYIVYTTLTVVSLITPKTIQLNIQSLLPPCLQNGNGT